MHPSAAPSFSVRLLGRFEVRRDGREQSEWTRAGPRQLLKRLALAPQLALGVPELAEALWPGADEARVRQRLHHQIYLLRRALGAPETGADPGSPVLYGDGVVALRAEWFVVDAASFELRLGAALRGNAVAAIDAALSLYTGPLLPGEVDDEVLNQRRVALERLYVAGLLRCARLERAEGALAAAAARLQRALACEPAHEEAHRLLIEVFGARGERSLAEQQYLQCRSALAAELGVLPDASTHQAYRDAMRGSPNAAEVSPPKAPPRLLPPPLGAPLLGRDALLSRIAHQLTGGEARLLTLTGPGGIGKTQLALRAAHRCLPAFGDGVCLVPLAETDASGVLERLARALDLSLAPDRAPTQSLVDALRPRHLLLLVDNCEHVQAALGVLSELLVHCPRLTVLATSRRRLNLQQEAVLPVPGLAPTADAAGALFVDRARAVEPELRVEGEDARLVGRIVEQLEGNPLSIELAAARVHVLGLQALHDSLMRSLALVAGGGPDRPRRHRSLEDSLRWSLQQLTAVERAVLDRSTLFAAPFTLAALEALCADLTPDIVSVVQPLLELHLLSRAPGERLRQQPGSQSVLRDAAAEPVPSAALLRLLDWYVALTGELDTALAGAQGAAAAARLDAEIDNLYALLALAQQQGCWARLCRLVRSLARYWVRSHSWERPLPWIALARSRVMALEARERALFGHAVAVHAFEARRYDVARDAVALALAAAEEVDDRRLLARVAVLYAACCYHLGESGLALEPLLRARSAALALGDEELLRTTLNNLGSCQMARGDLRAAVKSWNRCDRSFGDAEVPARVALRHNLSLVEHYRGRSAEALRWSDRAIAIERATLARPPRLAVLWLRRCWLLARNRDAAAATEALVQTRAAAQSAALASFDAACAAHAGKLAFINGRSEQAVALLTHAIGAEAGVADLWDMFDARLWLVGAQLSLRQWREAGQVLLTLRQAAPGFLHERARLLEAMAAWLLARGEVDTAAQAWSQAVQVRRQQGVARFAAEQPRARRTQAQLRQALGAEWIDGLRARAGTDVAAELPGAAVLEATVGPGALAP